MERMTKILFIYFILVLGFNVSLWSGQKKDSGIRFDFDYKTSGNQNDIHEELVSSGQKIYLEVHVTDARNLDTYEFNVNYPNSQIRFVGGYEDNPFSGEKNILKKNGGSPGGFAARDQGTTINVVNTLIGNHGENSPDGNGLLGLLIFTTTKTADCRFSFKNANWYNNVGFREICKDKGHHGSLPVEMSDMSATADRMNGVMIMWETVNKTECQGFHIWKSEHELDYKKITESTIKSHENQEESQPYQFNDRNVKDGVIYFYKIEKLSKDGVSIFYGPISIEGISPVPVEFDLSQNYPNPFNPSTTFDYQLPKDCEVEIRVYNIMGSEVKTLVHKQMQAGYHSVIWNGLDNHHQRVSSGIYFVRIQAADFIETKRMILQK